MYQKAIRGIRSIPNFWNHCQIHIVHDGHDWVVQEISKGLAKTMTEENLAYISTSPFFYYLAGKIIHFNSIIPPGKLSANKVIMTWYHVNQNDKRLCHLEKIASTIDILHTTSQITKQILIHSGFPEKKIVVLPMGVDLQLFRTFSTKEKNSIRASFNIPPNAFVIGSFQKDGVGWGAGLEPKMIKGPDILCDVVEQLSRSYPIHVLLSGPSRGYVKKRLERAGIGYTHRYLKQYSEINTLFHACDLYLIASRNEGVPMALLESWATGTPLVSTRVGMVADVAISERNALLVNVEDRDTLAEHAARIFEDNNTRNRLIVQGQEAVKQYGWNTLIHRYWQELYNPLLSSINKEKE